MPNTVAFLTLGCAKNEVDTADMQEALVSAGFDIVNINDPADAIVINTCAFIQPAIEESIDTILEIAGLEEVASGSTKLIVVGCMPSRFGEELIPEFPEVSHFIPCANEDSLVDVVSQALQNPNVESRTVEFSYNPSEYVKISDGCSRHCAFCTIPSIRGPYHSFTFDSIYSDIAQKVKGGAKEIVLIAQDSGMWGLDLEPRESLASLLRRLASSFPTTWFRVLYLEPVGVTDELISVLSEYDNICNYLDIPFQHCDSAILKSMNRSGSRKEFEQLIHRIRQSIPDITLRTTLIVGYPGETDEQFEDLCDFISEAQLDYVGVFAYSREEGTKAASLPDQIDEDTKQERLQTIRDLADAVSAQKIAQRIGEKVNILVLGAEEDGQLYGRCQSQAPEVDGVTYIENASIGQFVSATITDTLLYEMEATCD
ncbi:MAG: 30S ribosomal protein S12 methylthiotransferase RimO [Eggerthellaceae bacterium]|nr:30S ribosomal protein S12 methylthiotransferase RimO [Eggerthellaceae bacterium]